MNGYVVNRSGRKALSATGWVSAIAIVCLASVPAAAQSAADPVADPVEETASEAPAAEDARLN